MVGLETEVVGRRGRLFLERRAAVLALDDVGAGQPDALVVVRDRSSACCSTSAAGWCGSSASTSRRRPRCGTCRLPSRARSWRRARRASTARSPGRCGPCRRRECRSRASSTWRRASVRLVDRAARAAAVEAEGLAQALVGRRVEDVRIARIHHEVRRARERVDVEHLASTCVPASVVLKTPRSGLPAQRFPTAATYATFGSVGSSTTRPIDRVSCRPRYVHVLAGVGGAVHAAAPRRALAVVLLAGAGPDDLASRARRSRARRTCCPADARRCPSRSRPCSWTSRCRRSRRRRRGRRGSSGRSAGRGCGRRWPPGRCRGNAGRRTANARPLAPARGRPAARPAPRASQPR